MIEQANNFIGMPYDADNFHCWHLVMELVPKAPRIDTVHKNLYTTIKEFDAQVQEYDIKEVTDYRDGDIIILGRNNVYHHAGVYFQDGLIHNDETSGVIYQSMSIIKRNFTSIKGLRV